MLYEIYRYIVDYWRNDATRDYTLEELEEIDLIQEYELHEFIYGSLHEDGVLVYDNYSFNPEIYRRVGLYYEC